MGKKIKLFTHNDLDGVGCAIVLDLFTKVLQPEDELDYEFCNYDNIDSKVYEAIKENKYDEYYITDISVCEKVAEMIDARLFDKDVIAENNNKEISVLLVDHHATALPLNRFKWCNVSTTLQGVKTCGTEMLYKSLVLTFKGLLYTFREDLNKYQDIKDLQDVFTKDHYLLSNFVEYVRLYDTWDWTTTSDKESGLKAKQLNDLLHIYGIHKFFDKMKDRIRCNQTLISSEDELILSIEEKRIKDYINKKEKTMMIHGIPYGDKTHQAGIVFAESYISELGNKICENHPEIDYIMMINMDSKTISLRTVKEDVNVGLIAKSYGGGGHQKAAGFMITDDIKINTIFKIVSSSIG